MATPASEKTGGRVGPAGQKVDLVGGNPRLSGCRNIPCLCDSGRFSTPTSSQDQSNPGEDGEDHEETRITKNKEHMGHSIDVRFSSLAVFPNTIRQQKVSIRAFFPGSTKCRGAAGKRHAGSGERRAPARAPEHLKSAKEPSSQRHRHSLSPCHNDQSVCWQTRRVRPTVHPC